MLENEFVEKVNSHKFDEMTIDEMEEFAEKCVRKNISMKDVLFSIAMLAGQVERNESNLKEHIEKGYHRS